MPEAAAPFRSPAISALESVTVERRYDVPFGSVAVSNYHWRKPTEDIWTLDSHFIDFPLTPRPRPSWAKFDSGTRAPLVPLGRVMFVPAGHTVRSGAAVGKQRSLDIQISVAALAKTLGRDPAWSETKVMDGLRFSSVKIEWLLQRIYQELRAPGFGSDVMIDAFVRALSVALVRRFGLDEDAVRGRTNGGLAPWRMRRIQERVLADIPAPTLQELADLCDISVRQLTRAFKAETGQTVAEHIQLAMIERALRLLTADTMAIAEIGRSLGFSSTAAFSYAFRRATGQSPRDARRRDALDLAKRRSPAIKAPGRT